jgi:hypothetical protein
VEAPRDMVVTLSARHDAGIAVWMNQHAVMQSDAARGVTDLTDPPPDVTDVELRKGWNEIVVKTEDLKQDWGFSLRLGLPPGVVCAQSDGPPAELGSELP